MEEAEVAVLFLDGPDDNDDGDDHLEQDVIQGLEMIDDALDKDDIELVICREENIAARDFGLNIQVKDFSFHLICISCCMRINMKLLLQLPSLVLFESGVPLLFPADGDLRNEHEVLSWIREVTESEEIPAVEKSVLEKLAGR